MADDASNLLPHERPAAPRADLCIALFCFVFGAAAAVVAYRMPRYTNQGGEIYTAPGLVPGLYGIVLVLLGAWLGARAISHGALRAGDASLRRPGDKVELRLALAAGLCLLFVVGLLGHMPFWLAAAMFVAAFTITFEWQSAQQWPTRLRRVFAAILLGLATGVCVTLVFEKLFYVRLP
jgi:Tripartite tricarboxylate transporter TctB family